MGRFRFRFDEVTYIDPDSHGWGHPGTVLFGRMEVGSLRVGERVEVATNSGPWHRAVTTLADPDFRKMGKPGEYLLIVVAGEVPPLVTVYFGAQPPSRDIVCPGVLEGESTPNQTLQPTAGAVRLSGVRSSLGPWCR